ncbi:carboxylate--amine ligase [Chitinimonas sp. BJB300]|uniref:carboxylate--amine ligase n=1 Tax=Chitinimonas sp. BJB300 TaxID=1559339 RepID=UPI000C0F2422|nr:carboxylate--amine ligase [Chitinimonas sp. BJB300]PHV12106.1 carboxylate--amine ligase [Chitinimonas sp. BJB300]
MQPPCIVLGLETQIGLSLVRELGRAGVRVIGITQDPHAIGLHSRFLSEGVVVKTARSPELMETIRSLGERYGPCCLMAVAEVNLNWLSEHRGQFGKVEPILPDPVALATVLDKQATLQAAQQVGIAIPTSVEPHSHAELAALAQQITLPAVLKWKDPNLIAPLLAQHGLSLIKAEYVYSAEALLAALNRYSVIDAWPLVQAYCGGYGLGQFFFMHQGQALRRFQHRRIAEWPPEGGFSSVCDALPLHEHADLQEKSIALLRAIGWEGVAMVEYRYDPVSQRAVLMEINGRFWGSYPLALYAQADFALLSYQVGSGLPISALPAPRSDVRCRMVATELKRLVRICLQPDKIADRSFSIRPMAEITRFVIDFFRPGVRYYVWCWNDPKPFWADLTNLLRGALRFR